MSSRMRLPNVSPEPPTTRTMRPPSDRPISVVERFRQEQILRLEAPLGQTLLVMIAQERIERLVIALQAIRKPVVAEQRLHLRKMLRDPRHHEHAVHVLGLMPVYLIGLVAGLLERLAE